ncbi:MAG: PQQ-like beta-propeller repeat protein [Fuerstiella sp.]|nr:PQQ-like beta-propeller repeat protein [Fuerstiella sp.]
MKHPQHQNVMLLNCVVYFVFLVISFNARGDWPQWGGPQRDFQVPNVNLKATWPTSGPEQLWRRSLGDGFSSIVVTGRQLITMYRANDREHIVSLDIQTGETIWDHDYNVQFLTGTNVEEFGPGPLSTPLITGERICTVGVTGVLHCLATDTGAVVWKRDLLRDLKGTNLYRGYSASPIAWEDTIILPVGGADHGLVAFRVRDGSIAWQRHDFAISHVSPILIRVGRQDQLVVVADTLIAGFDPATGNMLWKHKHPIAGGYVSSTPVCSDDGRLFFSAAYGIGSRCVQLDTDGTATSVREVWHNTHMRVHHSNVIRVGDVVYGTSGDFTALLFTAMDLNSGEVLWRQRQPGRANCIYADRKFIVLQEDGTLMLATMTPNDVTIHSTVKLFDGLAWTCPTLDGKRLYVRNREEIMALELP